MHWVGFMGIRVESINMICFNQWETVYVCVGWGLREKSDDSRGRVEATNMICTNKWKTVYVCVGLGRRVGVMEIS